MKEDNDVTFLSTATDLVEKNDFTGLRELLQDERNQRDLTEFSSELIEMIDIQISKDKSESVLEECQACLKLVGQKGSPKQVIISIISIIAASQLYTDSGRIKFYFMLKPLEEALIKTEDAYQKNKQVDHSLSIVVKTLQNLVIPSTEKLEGKERILVDASSEIVIALDVLDSVLSFLQSLSEKISLSEKSGDHMRKAILASLDKPFSFCSLHIEKESKTHPRSRIMCRKYVRLLVRISPDIIPVLLSQDWESLPTETKFSDFDVLCDIPRRGIAVLFYLALDDADIDIMPYCYHPFFLLIKLSTLIKDLIDSVNYAHVMKGLVLLRNLLNRIGLETITKSLIDSSVFTTIIDCLVSVFTTFDSTDHRQIAHEVTKMLYKRVRLEARPILLTCLFRKGSSSPPGLRGWVLSLLKDAVTENIRSNAGCQELVGKSLENLLRTFVYLPDGVETDLIQEKEVVLSVINCFGCLLRIDEDNVTGIQDLKPWFQKDYIEPLKKSVELAYAHYEQELKLTESGQSAQVDKDPEFSLNDALMSQLTPEQKIGVLKDSLMTLDLIKFTLGRFAF